MKKIAVDVLIKRLSILTAGLSNEVKELFAGLSEEDLNWQPNENSWSIAQILDHLNAFYRYYNPVFSAKIANTRFHYPIDSFTSSPLGRAVYTQVKLGKVQNVKRKLKAAKEYNPLVNSALKTENPIDEYLKFQDEFIEVVKSAEGIDIRKTKCPISVRPLVKLDLGDAFLYIAYHNERHIYQAKRVLNKLNRRKAS